VAHLRRIHGSLHERTSNIFEQRLQVDVLLVTTTDGHLRLLAHDGNDWLVIQRRIVQSIQQVDGTGPGGTQADAGLSGVFGVGAGHQRRELFVGWLDEARLVARALDAPDDSIDAIAGVPNTRVTPQAAAAQQ
jgi:hypothetical protein